MNTLGRTLTESNRMLVEENEKLKEENKKLVKALESILQMDMTEVEDFVVEILKEMESEV